MRILHLDSGREMRGGQWQALRLHRKLIEAGHDSMLLAAEDSPLLNYGAALLRPLRLAQISRSFDIAHAHDSRSHTLCALFARVPLVVSRRVAFPIKTGFTSRWKYRRPALFLAVSNFVAQQLRKGGVEEYRISVVYDGVPVPAEAARGEAMVVPFSLDPGKGMALAEQAARLAGIQLQRSSDLPADLQHAKGLVYLSESEGLGSGILLAMALGVPVIASNVGGIPELVEDNGTGVLVPNRAEAIAAAFLRLDPRMGAAARLKVIGGFTEDHMLNATLAAYTRALHRA